ncbi:MAG: Crp/Fnr family transcriptional regulator [Bacteroidota bacterium]|nr:Crp/Fnr family transcriptional regulator [Bacteroidota bacterium]
MDLLLQAPVFQGVSRVSLTNSLEKYSLEFLKFKQGEQIVAKGELFTHVKFIISGKVVSYTENNTGILRVKEVIIAPSIVAGNYIFGLETKSIYDIYAHTDVGMMQIKKDDFLDLLRKEPIFNLNYLNFLSVRSQSYYHTMLSVSSGDPKERIAMWILLLTHKRAEEIELQISKANLSALMGVAVKELGLTLDELRVMKLLTYSDEGVQVLDRHGLVDFIHDIDDAD